MKINKIITEEIRGFINEAREHLIDYFINTWSKSQNVQSMINNSNYLNNKYSKYLEFTPEQWNEMTDEELLHIWNEWDMDEKLVTTNSRRRPK